MDAPVIQLIEKAAKKYNVPPEYAKAIAKIESNYNPNAVSTAGAKGVFQLMDNTAKMYGVQNSFNPEQNINAGVKHFSNLLAQNDNDVNKALAAYNAGQGVVNKYGGVPPFPETQNYVKKFNDMVNSNDSQQPVNPDLTNLNTLDILKMLSPQSGQPSSLNFDPNSFVRPVNNSPILDNFNRAMGAIATLGGTGAEIIGGIRGHGSNGGQSTQAGVSLLNQLQKQQQEAQNQKILNSIYQNPNIPQDVRASVGLTQTGLPGDVIKQLTGGNQVEQLLKAAQVKRAFQEIDQNSPEGLNQKYQRDLEKESFKRDLQLETQKSLLEFKASLKENDPIKEADSAMKLRKEFNAIPQVKDYNNLSAANERMNAVYDQYRKNPNDFQSRSFLDQSLIIGFNKVLDPGSVVRESEYARTPEGLAVINRIQGALEKYQHGGGGLTDEDRGELVKAMNLLQKGQAKEYKTWEDFYKDEALKQNISPSRIIKNLRSGASEEVVKPSEANPIQPAGVKAIVNDVKDSVGKAQTTMQDLRKKYNY